MTSLSILLVDDDEQLPTQLQLMLRDYEVTLHQATTQTEVLRYLKTRTVDMVLIDIFLPNERGFLMVETIRRQAIGTASIILATTPYYTLDTQRETLSRGFGGWLLKPFHSEEFLPYLKSPAQVGTTIASTLQKTPILYGKM